MSRWCYLNNKNFQILLITVYHWHDEVRFLSIHLSVMLFSLLSVSHIIRVICFAAVVGMFYGVANRPKNMDSYPISISVHE